MRHEIEHPVINDADFAVWQQYAVRAWPTLVLIDAYGKIVATKSGEILAEQFSPIIETLIAAAESAGQLNPTPLDLRPEITVEPLRPLSYPSKILAVGDGRLFIADTGHHRILQVRLSADGLSGQIGRVFGSGQPGLQDGPADTAAFHSPHGLTLSGDTLYVADTENHAVRAIDLTQQTVRLFAGTGQKAHGGFNLRRPTETPLRSPWALLAEEDMLFMALAGSHQIWVAADDQIGPFVGNGREALVDGSAIEASFNQPSDLAYSLRHFFIADAEASAVRAVSLEAQPRVLTLVGQGLFEFGDVDGFGAEVRLQHPTGLTFGDGLVYIADSYNHKIKTLNPTTGEVKTLIGTGQPGHADGPFSQASLFEPEGAVVEGSRLYIADTNNHLIRVANLLNQTLHTLRLEGLEQLAWPVVPEMAGEVIQLDPLTVGPGEVTVTLNVVLPEGYKLNATAPQLLHVTVNGDSFSHTFTAAERPAFTVTAVSAAAVSLGLTLYYCETGDQRLCLIHTAQLNLPLAVVEGADRAVEARYRLDFSGNKKHGQD